MFLSVITFQVTRSGLDACPSGYPESRTLINWIPALVTFRLCAGMTKWNDYNAKVFLTHYKQIMPEITAGKRIANIFNVERATNLHCFCVHICKLHNLRLLSIQAASTESQTYQSIG